MQKKGYYSEIQYFLLTLLGDRHYGRYLGLRKIDMIMLTGNSVLTTEHLSVDLRFLVAKPKSNCGLHGSHCLMKSVEAGR